MSIRCLANDYDVKQIGNKSYVYNEVYEGTQNQIIAAALLGIFYPDAADYYVPVCIEISNEQEDITIGKKMEVNGKADYRFFIADHQYRKWKKAYFIVMTILYAISLLLNAFSIALVIKTEFSVPAIVCAVIILGISIGAFLRLRMNNRQRLQYDIEDISIND